MNKTHSHALRSPDRRAGIVAFLLLWLLIGPFLSPVPAGVQGAVPTRRVNVPYFDGQVRYSETAIFWFGQVNSTDNYADVRIGYNDEHLYVQLAVFDRYLWYDDTSPIGPDLTEWDAAALYLDVHGNGGSAPVADDYCFVNQLNFWQDRADWQAAYRGNGSGWVAVSIPFDTESIWRGNAPNDDGEDDQGWLPEFTVPFTSLGLSGPPPQGTVWRMAIALHDRDDLAGTSIADKTWPEAMSAQQPATWGKLAFGLPAYTPPSAVAGGTVTIRHRLNGATVADAAVGGTIGNLCPGDPDYVWNQWGNANFGGATGFNIQNQGDVADWPCFAKYYITFPLDALPPDKAIISATLTLHHWGGSDPSQAYPSHIQALTVAQDWDENTLAWNNAPLAVENVSVAKVDPLPSFPGWPGVPYTWDVSGAVAEAYAAGTPLRLALYEADWGYHSGKFFVSSDTGDWNEEGRPTLRVRWGEPTGAIEKAASSREVMPGETITYTLTVVGSGQALTLADDLPAGVSAPLAQSPGLTYAPHRLTWTGTPDPGQQVVLTYVVVATAPSRTALWNQATLTQVNGLTDTSTVLVLVDPARTHLPLLLKGN